MTRINWILRCVPVLLCVLPIVAQARVVQFMLPSKLVVTAQYHAGLADKPAVLLLHGFLQTRDAPPMSTLGQSLADAGYTVLMPTLSLGYSQRNQSLACEAMHTHTLQNDTAELALWVDWLDKNSHGPIFLVGHSNGSAVVMNYIAQRPAKSIQGAILTSVVPIKIDPVEYQHALEDKTQSSAAALKKYRISYCQHSYLSSAAGYLSYARLSERTMLAKLHKAKKPFQIIVGSADQVFSPGWERQLKTAFPSTIVIPGAGHFFDGAYEFALLDQVQLVLNQWPKRKGT